MLVLELISKFERETLSNHRLWRVSQVGVLQPSANFEIASSVLNAEDMLNRVEYLPRT